MTRARLQEKEFEVVQFLPDDWVLRDSGGNVLLVSGDSNPVEVQCERCGSWNTACIPMDTGRWVCADTECYDEELRATGNRGPEGGS